MGCAAACGHPGKLFFSGEATSRLLEPSAVPCCVLAPGTTKSFQLHVFYDASELGYAACCYSRFVDEDGQVRVELLFAKAKVSPTEAQSIPRLELIAAVLGTKVLTIVTASIASLGLVPEEVFAYSDSTTVLAWLAKPSKTWATFVQNRVSEIQEVVQRPRWFHVRTEENPADIASRGLAPQDLESCREWWHGPKWLASLDFETPNQSHLQGSTTEEARPDPPVCFFVNDGLDQPEVIFQDLSK